MDPMTSPQRRPVTRRTVWKLLLESIRLPRLLSTVLAFAIGGLAVSTAALDLSKMQNLIPGRTAFARDPATGENFRMYFGNDKVVSEIHKDGNIRQGEWRFRPNGQVCIQWRGAGEWQCFFMAPMGGQSYRFYTTDNQLYAVFNKIVYGRPPELRNRPMPKLNEHRWDEDQDTTRRSARLLTAHVKVEFRQSP